MVHPFAHMNSMNAQAAFDRPGGDFTQRRRAEFAAMVRGAGVGEMTAAPTSERIAPAAVGGQAGAAAAFEPPVKVPIVIYEMDGTVGLAPDFVGDNSGSPHFAEVPDSARFPLGPYHQAPPEYGGKWWFVSPFTGADPWKQVAPPTPEASQPVPQAFLSIFGARPERGEMSYMEHQIAVNHWQQDLKYFEGSGVPEELDPAQVELAGNVFEAWGMGRPVYYKGRYGWVARFPDSAFPDFQANPHTAVTASHLVVAQYQVKLLQGGTVPEQPHPFVPPRLFPGYEDIGFGMPQRTPLPHNTGLYHPPSETPAG